MRAREFSFKIYIRQLLLLFLLTFTGVAFAQKELYEFNDPAQEALYLSLIAELRCLVCQNQNLAESNADLAKDLRQKTWELVVNGETEQQVIDFMVSRYGEFVLYRPPVNARTLFLWLGPFILLGCGVVAIVLLIRRRDKVLPEFNATDRERVRALLDAEDDR